jgi:hypothetical protein
VSGCTVLDYFAYEVDKAVGNQKNGQYLGSCGVTVEGTAQWVCPPAGLCSNSSLVFSLNTGRILHVNITSNRSQTSIVPSNTSCTVSGGSQHSVASFSNKNETTVVGAAVGASLGALLLATLAWAFWERHKRLSYGRSHDQYNDGSQPKDMAKEAERVESELLGTPRHELQ